MYRIGFQVIETTDFQKAPSIGCHRKFPSPIYWHKSTAIDTLFKEFVQHFLPRLTLFIVI